MPATVVIVHDDGALTAQTKAALEQNGHDVATFADPMAALQALERARSADLLITRVNFGPGKPHGVSLALMARTRRPQIKVLFVTRPENQQHTEGVGELLPAPAAADDVIAAAERLLSGGQAAPRLIAQPPLRAEPAAALPDTSARARFGRQATQLLRPARETAQRARRTLQCARERRSSRAAPLWWRVQPL